MSPQSGPICFSETARGGRRSLKIAQHGCCVLPNLLPQPLASVPHILAKAAGGSEQEGLLC